MKHPTGCLHHFSIQLPNPVHVFPPVKWVVAVLLLFLSFSALADRPLAVIVASKAYVYADSRLRTPIGHLSRGKVVPLAKQVPWPPPHALPIIILGRVAYIKSQNALLNRDEERFEKFVERYSKSQGGGQLQGSGNSAGGSFFSLENLRNKYHLHYGLGDRFQFLGSEYDQLSTVAQSDSFLIQGGHHLRAWLQGTIWRQIGFILGTQLLLVQESEISLWGVGLEIGTRYIFYRSSNSTSYEVTASLLYHPWVRLALPAATHTSQFLGYQISLKRTQDLFKSWKLSYGLGHASLGSSDMGQKITSDTRYQSVPQDFNLTGFILEAGLIHPF